VVNVALLVPSTPGNLGALEAAAVLAMKILNVAPIAAVAVAVLYHAVQLLPLVVFAIANPRLMIGARSRRLAGALAAPLLALEPDVAEPPPGEGHHAARAAVGDSATSDRQPR